MSLMISAPLLKRHYIEKIIGLLFAGLTLILLTPHAYLDLFVVTGQAHFILAYYYQYRAQKINVKYISAYVLILAGLFYAAIYVLHYVVLAIISSIYFIHHFWLDERHLNQDPPHPLKAFEALPFFIMYTGYSFYSFYIVDVRKEVALLGGLGIFIFLAIVYIKKLEFSSKNAYFLMLNLFTFALCVSGASVSSIHLIGFIGFLHISNWYISSYYKFYSDKVILKSYLQNVLAIHLLVFCLFFFYKWFPQYFYPLRYFFNIQFYYVWAIIHILFTTRPGDLKYLSFKKTSLVST